MCVFGQVLKMAVLSKLPHPCLQSYAFANPSLQPLGSPCCCSNHLGLEFPSLDCPCPHSHPLRSACSPISIPLDCLQTIVTSLVLGVPISCSMTQPDSYYVIPKSMISVSQPNIGHLHRILDPDPDPVVLRPSSSSPSPSCVIFWPQYYLHCITLGGRLQKGLRGPSL